MKNKLTLLLLALSISSMPAAAAAEISEQKAEAKARQFVYVLKLIPRLHDDTAWTESDGAIIGRHVKHLAGALEKGQLILAGRTDEPGDKTFGLVVFEAADEESARSFMNSDPAVAEGIMTATLHPYYAAFLRGR